MGEVYRARDPRLGREVAIKVLSTASGDRDEVARFEQEARAAGSLNHPNIVVVYDVGVHGDLPYVVTELLKGETLRKRLRRGPLPVRKALDYAVQVAQGLAAAHEEGIFHRDLKPDNLFITDDGRVKILDFGLAKLAQWSRLSEEEDSGPTLPATEPGTILGTVGYMAPEQVRGRASGPRADIFSLGAVLYEALEGRKTFPGDSPADVMSAILREDPPPILESGRQLPPSLSHIIQHCLEKDAGDRFQSARDLAFDLQEAQLQLTPSDTVSPTRKRQRWARRTPVWVAVALGVAISGSLWAGKVIWDSPARSFQQLTFRRGTVLSARIAPDTRSVIYAAAWEGRPVEVYLMTPGRPESRALDYEGAQLLAVSKRGDLALGLEYRYAGGERFSGTLARTPLTGGAARELLEDVEEADWSPDGTELAVVRSSGLGALSRLEYPIGTLLYETQGAIRNVRVTPDGETVALFDDPIGMQSSGAVMVVDRGGEGRALTPPWRSARGLAWRPDGDEVWFTAGDDEAARALHAVSLSGASRIVAQVPGSVTLHDIGSDGAVLISRDEERHGILCLAPGASTETSLSWFDESGVGDISADGQLLLFGDRGGVYLRRTDGSPAIRLGEGFADALSPDGRWVLAASLDARQLLLLPTGPGVPMELPHHAIDSYAGAWWFPDGKRVLFNGREPGRGLRAYVQELESGPPRPVTPEGVWGRSISPDGKLFAAIRTGGGILLYRVDGGQARPLAGSEPGDRPAGWTADGRRLWVFRRGQIPAPVYQLEATTGRRHLWRQLMPADSAGVVSVTEFRVTPDGLPGQRAEMTASCLSLTAAGSRCRTWTRGRPRSCRATRCWGCFSGGGG
jgi:serine/threonine protein kinase